MTSPVGFTRRAIGATFAGQTKDDDGQAWADVEIEGIDSEVSATLCHLEISELTGRAASTGTSSPFQRNSRGYLHSHPFRLHN